MFGCNGKWNFSEIHFLLTNIYSFDPEMILHSHFYFKSFPERERERERERAQIGERERKKRLRRRSHRSSDDCAARRHGVIVGAVARSGLSLLSLSLSLSLFPEVIWSENEGRNWFLGQRWKYWSTGSHFPENDIFRDSQTCGKGWKWFPEIIFTQNKRTLNLRRVFDRHHTNTLLGVFFVFILQVLSRTREYCVTYFWFLASSIIIIIKCN